MAVATQQTWSLKLIATLLTQRLSWSEGKAASLIDCVSQSIAKGLADKREVIIQDFAKFKTADNAELPELTVPSEEINAPISEFIGIDKNDVELGIKTYFNIIKEKLIINDRLKIERFIALKISEEKED